MPFPISPRIPDFFPFPKNLTASKEVILSAGTIGTPSILLHSGIGNATTLTSLGITPRINLPSVGQNLHRHVDTSENHLAFLRLPENSSVLRTFGDPAAGNETAPSDKRKSIDVVELDRRKTITPPPNNQPAPLGLNPQFPLKFSGALHIKTQNGPS
ncbi:aryl-alcohol-oxidase from pleurotus Eryingii [Lentinula edodes]|uniref:Aryl-alcohol-oxidase from pleurotus Eryingii n=1 Tax=Lentinula edodes TaxID=5353 RepID=A0A1Q3ERY2_LENED|nr:aryl-alcohol-oxidase from pleurotus Eryingii [Lentinula edodes]